MKLREFLALLRAHPDKGLTLNLPDGSAAPAHFHITEIGHLVRSFTDCGGEPHRLETCLFQIWVAHDYNHRIRAGKLAAIIEKAEAEFPDSNLPVEFEHEAPVLTQLPIASHEITKTALVFNLRYKATDCLAKDICLPKPDFSLPDLPKKGLTTGSVQLFRKIES